jgi:hypothetical protein
MDYLRSWAARLNLTDMLRTGFSVKDTAPEINEMVFKRTMALTDSQRFLMGMSMLTTAREMIWASLPRDISEPQRRRMFYQRLYGEELPDAVANWVPTRV